MSGRNLNTYPFGDFLLSILCFEKSLQMFGLILCKHKYLLKFLINLIGKVHLNEIYKGRITVNKLSWFVTLSIDAFVQGFGFFSFVVFCYCRLTIIP
jgi:hypothetical protein